MAYRIFYSWQTDSPSATNRNFIEGALKKAIKKLSGDAELVNAIRNEGLALDKDTKGEPGTPPIVQTIFEKIDQSAVFVSDLTFVAKTAEGRLTPNPNVLIEYGWALKSRGHGRIVPVMNTEFGKPSWETLPFNMRHLRWPLTYALAERTSGADRSKVQEELVDGLEEALRTILDAVAQEIDVMSTGFEAVSPTFDEASFFQQGEKLATYEQSNATRISYMVPPSGAKMFLRLIPTTQVETLSTKQAIDLMNQELETFCFRQTTGGLHRDRNQYGGITYRESGDRDLIYEMTQVLKNRELWGINCDPSNWKDADGRGVIAYYYEEAFKRTLQNYVEFARLKLELTLPLHFISGFTGINDYKIAAPPGYAFGPIDKTGGKAVEPNIVFEGEIISWEDTPEETLMPFFFKVWEAFGLDRPDTTNK